MIRIIIGDDHQMFIDGLKMLLATYENVAVVGEALNGEQVLEVLEKNPADIVLLDINMPIINGIATTRKIHKYFPSVKVLILTMYKRKEFITQLLAAGVSGYIMKNTGAGELYDAIRVVYEGGEYFGEEISKEILNNLRGQGRSEDVVFSKREHEVLKLLADELTSQEIAEKLFISFHTVESHRRNLLTKAGTKTTTGLIRFAVEHGLITGEDEELFVGKK
jgi:DNA-binding NarL/FixJ family response regulator